MTANDKAIWRHLTKAVAAIISGKHQTAIIETKKALELLQSTKP